MTIKRVLRRAGFHGLRILARQVGRGGASRLQSTGHWLGEWHFRLSPRKRRRLQHQITRALPGESAPADVRQWLHTAYRVNDRAVLELLAMYSGSPAADAIIDGCSISELHHLDRALQSGRGVILLGMHMGNGVAMAAHLHRRGYPVAVIYREAGKIQPHFFRDGLGSLGLEAIPAVPASIGVRQMLRALKNNRILFILMDQATKTGGVPARFLGKTMQMPPGPAELARRTGAPIVPALLEGVEPAWHFRVGEPVLLDADQPLEVGVEILTLIMQRHIEKHPQWWTWHQRRWSRYAFDEALE